MQYLQKENGASLVIASNAQAASALSFYLPNNPAVYVVRENKEITQFDFWAPFWDSAAAGDSAIFVTQGDIPADLKKSFDGVVPATDEPLPEVVQTWRFYKCANFKDTPEGASSGPPRTTNDEPLPK